MKFSIGKFVVLAVIAVLAIVAVNKYTSEKIGTEEGGDLANLLTAGLTDEPTTETEEEWDKPYSKKLVELIDTVESGEKKPHEQTEEDKQKMAGIQAEEIFNEEFDTENEVFPFVKKIALEARTRYNIVFAADKEIRFVVYAENKYRTWQDKGFHVTSKITTNSADGCCSTGGSYNMDINEGEGGDYYFLFDESDIEFETDFPTKVKIKVTKTGGI
jgi:hypothetical protein